MFRGARSSAKERSDRATGASLLVFHLISIATTGTRHPFLIRGSFAHGSVTPSGRGLVDDLVESAAESAVSGLESEVGGYLDRGGSECLKGAT